MLFRSAAEYSVPVSDVEQISDAQSAAMVEGFHAFAKGGAVFTLLTTVLFVAGQRRHRRDTLRFAEVTPGAPGDR